jgi:hypothetical protein
MLSTINLRTRDVVSDDIKHHKIDEESLSISDD